MKLLFECEKVRDEKFKSHQEKLAKLERENTYYMESKGKKRETKEEVNEKKNELKIWFLQKIFVWTKYLQQN